MKITTPVMLLRPVDPMERGAAATSSLSETTGMAKATGQVHSDALDTLSHARVALRDVPDVDRAMVATLKAALAKGELVFDPNRLADCMLQHHGVTR